MAKIKIEHYRQGYPRLAAFLSVDRDFTVLKRFDNLHMRSLLDQQDRLTELESQLNQCDDAEETQLHLSSRRQDGNQTRRDLVAEIKVQLRSYDKAVLAYHDMLALPQAQIKHRESIMHWVQRYKPLVRSESSCFLGEFHRDDFVALKTGEGDKGGIEILLDMVLKACPRVAKMICSSEARTDDANIVLFPPQLIQRIVRVSVTILVPLWLITPAILLFTASEGLNRTVIYSMFTLGTSFFLSFITSVTKYHLIMAVVTYGAVLAAFLSGSPSAKELR